MNTKQGKTILKELEADGQKLLDKMNLLPANSSSYSKDQAEAVRGLAPGFLGWMGMNLGVAMVEFDLGPCTCQTKQEKRKD